MKAVIYDKYGPPEVLHLAEINKPAPGINELLIKVSASSVATGDVNIRGFTFVPAGLSILARLMFGLFRPQKKILGFEFAGVVEEMGKEVTQFKIGDPVFGIDGNNMGAYAQYKTMAADEAIALKPVNLSFEKAAGSVNGALTAYHFLKVLGHIQKGEKVLVIGASGSVGAAGVQIAKSFDTHVTGICSTVNVDLVHSLGVDRVVDYKKEDFLKTDEYYDIIMDNVGNLPLSKLLKHLKPEGRVLLVAAGLPQFLMSAWINLTSKQKARVGGGMDCEKQENLEFIKTMIEEGRLKTIVDKVYPITEIVEAHRYVDTGRKKGNVIISLVNW